MQYRLSKHHLPFRAGVETSALGALTSYGTADAIILYGIQLAQLPRMVQLAHRVSTKWLNLLRKFFFCELLRNFSFAQFAQNRKFYTKCNFLGKLSKIDILSLELNN